MAIVVYKCDTCKREIELQRNIEGLEHVGRCNITHGCRGKLYQVRLLPDYIRGTIPDPVSGLDDWKSRKVLHNHAQAVERDEWIIVHNMGAVPIVSVFVDRPIEGNLDNREEITPDDIIIVNDNTIRLVFSRSWSGIAQLVARQSDPDLFKPTIREAVEVESPIQFSSGGEISIATRIGSFNATSAISLEVEFTTPSGITDTVQYSIDTEPSLASPWVDYDQGVIVKGQIYSVRSFNGIVPEMTFGAIGSGSTFKFTGVDSSGGTGTPSPIATGDILVLLAGSPYQPVDKILNQYVDVTDVTSEKNPSGFYYNNGEFFVVPEVPRDVYPLIRSV